MEGYDYAKCIEISKRVRWDIDKDVIRGREFDISQKFLPDGLSKVNQLDFLNENDRRVSQPGPRPDLCQHVRICRTFHRRQDP